MKDSANESGRVDAAIKERLLCRLKRVKQEVGPQWRELLAAHDPDFYDSLEGTRYMLTAAQALTNPRRGSIHRLERVTRSLEEIATTIHTQAHE